MIKQRGLILRRHFYNTTVSGPPGATEQELVCRLSVDMLEMPYSTGELTEAVLSAVRTLDEQQAEDQTGCEVAR